MFRDLVKFHNGTYTPPPPHDDLPPAPPPNTDWTDDEGYGEGEVTEDDIAESRCQRRVARRKAGSGARLECPTFIPAKNVTLLYADGGTGKSLLALQLCVASATNTSWLGHLVKFGARALHDSRRFARGTAYPTRRHRTRVQHPTRQYGCSRTGELQRRQHDPRAALTNGKLGRTALYEEIDSLCAQARPTLLILDTAADTFDGDEMKRAHGSPIHRHVAPALYALRGYDRPARTSKPSRHE